MEPRRRVVVHFEIYPLGLYAPLLHVPYRFLSYKIPQPTISVCDLLILVFSLTVPDHSLSTGGCGFSLLEYPLVLSQGTLSRNIRGIS